jgi:methylthioribose-1-phosphate isomerase
MSERKIALLSDRFKTLWYEYGTVKILNRKTYPFSTEYVTCRTVEEVAVAIEKMIIQGAPPIAYAAGLALAMEAHLNHNKPQTEMCTILQSAASRLRRTRPTGWDLSFTIDCCLEIAAQALKTGENVEEAIRVYVYEVIEDGNQVARATGRHAADIVPDGARIQTMCFAGAALNYMLYYAVEDGKDIRVYASETRPYLQGARLTAQSAIEMDIPVTVVTDNMPGFLMYRHITNMLVTAADKITSDGYVANKIGTYQCALAAQDNDIPFYVLGYKGPAPNAKTVDTIVIEERDPEEVLYCLGVRTAAQGAQGFYPAFDITPPRLITAIVTDRGIFPPNLIWRYSEMKPEK